MYRYVCIYEQPREGGSTSKFATGQRGWWLVDKEKGDHVPKVLMRMRSNAYFQGAGQPLRRLVGDDKELGVPVGALDLRSIGDRAVVHT